MKKMFLRGLITPIDPKNIFFMLQSGYAADFLLGLTVESLNGVRNRTGEKFLRGLITPIDPKNIFFMLQSGYAADFLLGLTVESLNGVRNRSTAGGATREADPEFVRALQLLREVQAAGALGMRVEEDKAKGSTGVVFFRRDDVAADTAEKAAEVRQLLKLPADQDKYVLTYSPVRGAANELSVNSRSTGQARAEAA